MRCWIFAQQTEHSLNFRRLLANAARVFDVEIEVSGEFGVEELTSPYTAGARLVARSRRGGWIVPFSVRVRPASYHDMQDARDAEARSHASGMSLLADRCPSVWELESPADAAQAHAWVIAAVLASTALGPILPEDRSKLLGVRSAMLRADALHGAHKES